jgi:NADP-dependent aldehyde dehydrogenase
VKNPATGEVLEDEFLEATAGDIDAAARAAERAFEPYATLSPGRRAEFLRAIAQQTIALGDRLLARAAAETGLPTARLESERARTVGQILLFAELIEEGSWVGARIDRALSDRKPQPRPDIRRMLVPSGPVAVFGASNFPLAFSVAGGDTISALAAGCPVVVKAHPAHPGTSELSASAIRTAGRETGMPEAVFSMVHGRSPEVGITLVTHPAIRAAAFTGSLVAGRTLYDAAALRPEPIPVFAEMGSSNPVFLLPGALQDRGEAIARGFAASVTLGSGQFCTNPGLAVLVDAPVSSAFLQTAGDLLAAAAAGTMAHAGIKAAYDRDIAEVARIAGVAIAARSQSAGAHPDTEARAALLLTDARTYLANPRLSAEIYGPASVAVRCASRLEMLQLARGLHGHLTATVHGTERDLEEFQELVAVLRRKAGRLIFNGFPTGVEVCHAMHHGGPYPATADARETSVGSAAILRFARPVCYQDFPQSALPEELRNENPRGIWRMVDGAFTKDAV